MDYCQDHIRGHILDSGVSGNIRWVTSWFVPRNFMKKVKLRLLS
jgi:hypothetical protein